MINVQQISVAASDVESKRMSVYAFERWFRRESRNVHAWGDQALVSAVLSVESVLSAYKFDGLAEDNVGNGLKEAIRHFVGPAKLKIQYSQSHGRSNSDHSQVDFATAGSIYPVTRSNISSGEVSYVAIQRSSTAPIQYLQRT